MLEPLRCTIIVVVLLAVTPWNARAPGPLPLAASALPAPRDLATGNLVVNPGFESAFELHGAPELSVGAGWTPWFDARKVRPEYKGERYEQVRPDGSISAQSFRVFHGAAIQKMFTSSSVHDAGVGRESIDALVGQRRTRAVALPRQTAMYLLRQLTELSLVDIGRIFGGREYLVFRHGSVVYLEALP